jgi:prolyl-tRNA synthetase
LAIPVFIGRKTEMEKFAGALYTNSMEAMMPDGKALQAGTTHNLGQNFAKAFNVRFQTKNGDMEYVWQTSWGVSTRLVGALVMAHSDDQGLVIPPRLAPTQVVIVPIWGDEKENSEIKNLVEKILGELKNGVSVKADMGDQNSPGWKFNQYELLGVPLRIEIGPKELKSKEVVFVRRDNYQKEKASLINIKEKTKILLDSIQTDIFKKAIKFREENTFHIEDYEKFRDIIDGDGGFIMAHWCGNKTCENIIQEETKAIICTMPFESKIENGKCIICGDKSLKRVLFAKSY